MLADFWVVFLGFSIILAVPAAICGCVLLQSHRRFWREIHEMPASVPTENVAHFLTGAANLPKPVQQTYPMQ